ncbi:MAG: DUF1573 domain-containing protein [Planctomycetia bacterium]|nr:DUF1573 domain-containing protein [Planctomycetia bacterium]
MLYFAQTGSNQGRPFRSQTLLVRGGVLITLILLLPMLFHPPMERFDHGVAVAMVSAAPKKSEFVLPDSSGQDMPCRMLLPQEFHLGYVTPKSVHRFALELTNPTEESWYIDEIETECSCITVKERRELIGPHERAILDFEFTAPDIAGPYTKTITVRSAEKEWTTRFHARIDFPLVSEPEQLVRSLHRVSKPDEVILRNDGPVPIRLLYATVLPPVCTMKIGNDSVPAGGALTLPVQWLEEQGEAVVTIHTNHKRQKTLKVSIVP